MKRAEILERSEQYIKGLLDQLRVECEYCAGTGDTTVMWAENNKEQIEYLYLLYRYSISFLGSNSNKLSDECIEEYARKMGVGEWAHIEYLGRAEKDGTQYTVYAVRAGGEIERLECYVYPNGEAGEERLFAQTKFSMTYIEFLNQCKKVYEQFKNKNEE